MPDARDERPTPRNPPIVMIAVQDAERA